MCTWVVTRSARLVAAALSGLLLHLERVGARGGQAQPGVADHEQPHLTNLAPTDAPSTGALQRDGIPQPITARRPRVASVQLNETFARCQPPVCMPRMWTCQSNHIRKILGAVDTAFHMTLTVHILGQRLPAELWRMA